jgi:hypothetical protein
MPLIKQTSHWKSVRWSMIARREGRGSSRLVGAVPDDHGDASGFRVIPRAPARRAAQFRRQSSADRTKAALRAAKGRGARLGGNSALIPGSNAPNSVAILGPLPPWRLPGRPHPHGPRGGRGAGVGLEYAIDRNWSAKLEYLHVDLGTATFMGAASGTPTLAVPVTDELVRTGINYHW